MWGEFGVALRALQAGDYQKFDAVIGDHNCHLSALIAIVAAKELQDEISQLKIQKQFNIKAKKPTPPKELMAPYLPQLSETLRYLVHAAILRSGTECIEHPDGSMTLKTSAANIMGGKCSLAGALITPLREAVNRFSIAFIRRMSLSPHLEKVHLVTTCRDEKYEFVNAFYNMKETLERLASEGIHFVVVPYDRSLVVRGEPQIFTPSQERVASIDPESSIFVIQVFGSLNIEEVGLFRFILSSIAVNPIFEDHDPEEMEEIQEYRLLGQTLVPQCRIVHTYADTYKRMKFA